VRTNRLALTDVGPADEAALFALFSGVRAGELAMDGWDAALRATVLRQQFQAQRHAHRTQYPAAREQFIVVDDCAVGWAVLDRSGPAWHCVDLAIAAEHRRLGIATRVLRDWQQDAAAAGRGITLSVLHSNAAARALYERLGFRVAGQTDTHSQMEWRA
jgi:ribosomal protein S18 acetylase RimI-like enzyme